MNINPIQLMQIKGNIDAFKERHPKLELFLMDAMGRVDVGSVLEVSITSPQGNKIRTNFRVTPEDKELIEKLGSIMNKKQP